MAVALSKYKAFSRQKVGSAGLVCFT